MKTLCTLLVLCNGILNPNPISGIQVQNLDLDWSRCRNLTISSKWILSKCPGFPWLFFIAIYCQIMDYEVIKHIVWSSQWQLSIFVPHLESNESASMMTSLNGDIFRVTGPLCGEFTGHRWIPLTKAGDAELWCFLRSTPWINNREVGDLRRYCAHYDVIAVPWLVSWFHESSLNPVLYHHHHRRRRRHHHHHHHHYHHHHHHYHYHQQQQ